jgi:nitroimidazol reductase NimA-like FMN-containing flavoprotein (pyridoxamine 5'-phosphate oxidase superfamily)
MLGQLTPSEIEQLLHHGWIARLGLVDGDRAYVVPVTYAYDGAALYAHSNDGRKLRLLRRGGPVCVEVDEAESLDEWRSVIAYGRFEELHGADAHAALDRLVARFARHAPSHPHLPTHGRPRPEEADQSTPAATVYRIVLTERRGRFERR